LLPPLFTDEDLEEIEELLIDKEDIADGGAAMTAFAKMQFTKMTDFEAQKIQEALLKYCELDTFAIVMLYEYSKTKIES